MKLKETKNEFVEFLKDYKVIEMAIGVVIGLAAKELVTALVEGLIMPLVGILTPSGSWRNIVVTILNSQFKIGEVLGATVDFMIVALVVFIVIKKILKVGKN